MMYEEKRDVLNPDDLVKSQKCPVSVISDERSVAKGDPESREMEVVQRSLDPGSRPVSRDLAGMTECDIVLQAGTQRFQTVENLWVLFFSGAATSQ